MSHVVKSCCGKQGKQASRNQIELKSKCKLFIFLLCISEFVKNAEIKLKYIRRRNSGRFCLLDGIDFISLNFFLYWVPKVQLFQFWMAFSIHCFLSCNNNSLLILDFEFGALLFVDIRCWRTINTAKKLHKTYSFINQ